MSFLQQGAVVQTSSVVAVNKQTKWYAVYTKANHEKRVAEELTLRSVEIFLPLYEEIHQWKDRRRRIKIPLFSGYVFVRTSLESRSVMHQIPGFVRLVGFGGVPASLCDQQIESLRLSVSAGARAEPVQQTLKGSRVRIKNGPFAGFEGLAVRQGRSYRLVVSIDLIQRKVLVDVDRRSIAVQKSIPEEPTALHEVEED